MDHYFGCVVVAQRSFFGCVSVIFPGCDNVAESLQNDVVTTSFSDVVETKK